MPATTRDIHQFRSRTIIQRITNVRPEVGNLFYNAVWLKTDFSRTGFQKHKCSAIKILFGRDFIFTDDGHRQVQNV